ncbi:MAG: hypothetical protein E7090_05735 [Bacteroidales bacterium]|nr:hypothetical protein [Bacteroidales bacterium]
MSGRIGMGLFLLLYAAERNAAWRVKRLSPAPNGTEQKRVRLHALNGNNPNVDAPETHYM